MKVLQDELNWMWNDNSEISDDPEEELVHALSNVTGLALPMTRDKKRIF